MFIGRTDAEAEPTPTYRRTSSGRSSSRSSTGDTSKWRSAARRSSGGRRGCGYPTASTTTRWAPCGSRPGRSSPGSVPATSARPPVSRASPRPTSPFSRSRSNDSVSFHLTLMRVSGMIACRHERHPEGPSSGVKNPDDKSEGSRSQSVDSGPLCRQLTEKNRSPNRYETSYLQRKS